MELDKDEAANLLDALEDQKNVGGLNENTRKNR